MHGPYQTKESKPSRKDAPANQEMRRRLHAALDAELDHHMTEGLFGHGELTWSLQDGVIQGYEFGTIK